VTTRHASITHHPNQVASILASERHASDRLAHGLRLKKEGSNTFISSRRPRSQCQPLTSGKSRSAKSSVPRSYSRRLRRTRYDAMWSIT